MVRNVSKLGRLSDKAGSVRVALIADGVDDLRSFRTGQTVLRTEGAVGIASENAQRDKRVNSDLAVGVDRLIVGERCVSEERKGHGKRQR